MRRIVVGHLDQREQSRLEFMLFSLVAKQHAKHFTGDPLSTPPERFA